MQKKLRTCIESPTTLQVDAYNNYSCNERQLLGNTAAPWRPECESHSRNPPPLLSVSQLLAVKGRLVSTKKQLSTHLFKLGYTGELGHITRFLQLSSRIYKQPRLEKSIPACSPTVWLSPS